MTDKSVYPSRIWLLPGTGDEGETTWCDDPTPMTGMDPADAVEYVRADTVMCWQAAAKLPPDGITVPVINGGSITIGRYYAGCCWESEGGDELIDVSHWLMPQIPK